MEGGSAGDDLVGPPTSAATFQREPPHSVCRFSGVRQLIYTSRSLIGPDAGAIDSILAVSKGRNERCGITGMLWFGNQTFAQVLEGDAEAVGETMKRISLDNRHTDISIVEDREAGGRLFGTWTMLRADDGPKSVANTAYLVGLCGQKTSDEARKLMDFLIQHG